MQVALGLLGGLKLEPMWALSPLGHTEPLKLGRSFQVANARLTRQFVTCPRPLVQLLEHPFSTSLSGLPATVKLNLNSHRGQGVDFVLAAIKPGLLKAFSLGLLIQVTGAGMPCKVFRL